MKKKVLSSIILVFGILVLMVLCVIRFAFDPIIVSGTSMYPTLKEGEFGRSDAFFYKIFGIQRFDIITFEEKTTTASGTTTELWVKRVIGLPNETVAYIDNALYVNGEYVEETFIDSDAIACTCNHSYIAFCSESGVTLGEDEYFVMGDNRENSYDSRYLPEFIKYEQIKSKGLIISGEAHSCDSEGQGCKERTLSWPRFIGW